MSRVTAAFVCALCDPDDPRPASIMCSNNCGRYVCAVHAMPRRGPGSAMVCFACAEALGLLEREKPKAEPVPIVVIPSEPIAAAAPSVDTTVATRAEAPASALEPVAAPPPKVEATIVTPPVEAAPASPAAEAVRKPPAPAGPAKFDADATTAGSTSPASRETPASGVIPADAQSQAARRLVEPPPPPQSSETIVSQRGNTLQVPKVTQTLGRPPQPISARPRLAQRAEAATNGLNRQIILMAIGSIVLGIIGFVLILAALQ